MPAPPARAAAWRSPQSDAAAAFDWYRSESFKAYERPQSEVTGNKSDDYVRRAPGTAGMKDGVRYQLYESADGHVLFMASEREFWKNFCEGVGRPDLFEAHPGAKYADHAVGDLALRDELEKIFRTKTSAEWIAWSEEVNTPIAPVNTPASDRGRSPVPGPARLPARLAAGGRDAAEPDPHARRGAPGALPRPDRRGAHRRRAARRARMGRRPRRPRCGPRAPSADNAARRRARNNVAPMEELASGPEAEPPGLPDRPARESTLGATTPASVPPDDVAVERPTWPHIVVRVLILLLGGVTLYYLLPQILDVWTQVPRLRGLGLGWFVVMLLLESGSFACQWKLTRTALPQVSWFVAATSQLTSNAVSKIVPGGAVGGAATGYRMLSVSGVSRPTAGAALAATSIVSNGVLLALPMVAVIGSILTAPVPGDLAVIAWGGALLFLALFTVVFILVRFDRPLWAFGHLIERTSNRLRRHVADPARARVDTMRRGRDGSHHRPGPTAEGLVHQRDKMVNTLGPRWRVALAAAVGNWGLDYLALVAAIYAVTGSQPRLSVILLAYGAAAVLSMIPITPGGLGFVEAGLAATLVVAGVKGADALLATLAYRVVSYWLPLPAGLVASILFRRRYGRVEDQPGGPGGSIAGAVADPA